MKKVPFFLHFFGFWCIIIACFKYYVLDMTIHDKNLPHWDKFEDIEWKIDPAATNKDMADIIAKYREEMMDVLKSEEAEESEDENKLNGLIEKLKEKKSLLEDKLWETPPCRINLTDNTDITNFWRSIVDGTNPKLLWKPDDWWGSPTAAQISDIKTKIQWLLEDIQFLHDDWTWTREKSRKLFKGSSTEMTNILETLKNPLISILLKQTDPTKVEDDIKKFVKSVWKTKWNPFYIQSTKLFDNSQREVAIRVSLCLYCAYKLATDPGKFSKALLADIEDVLDNQLQPNEINKIKWLHNTKIELWYLEPEYETLKELNLKRWEIDQWTHRLWAVPLNLPINLTWEYESWAPITANIDEYRIIENNITVTDAWWTVYNAFLVDWLWNNGDLFSTLTNTKSVDFCIEVSWNRIKIWKLTLSNIARNATFRIDLDDESTVNSAFEAAWVTAPTCPLSFEIPVKWSKDVSNWLKWCKAVLTKKVKLVLDALWGGWWWGGWGWWWGGWTVGDLQIDAVVSDMWENVLKEKVAQEVEKQLEIEYDKVKKWNVYKKARFFFARWSIRNKMIKEKMDAISWQAFTWDSVIDNQIWNAADRHQLEMEKWLNGDIKNIDASTPVVYQHPQINDLCKKYMKWDVDDYEFQTKFNEILDSDNDLKDELESANIKHMWTNILIRMKQKLAWKNLIDVVNTDINWYVSDSAPAHIDNINMAIQEYIKTYQDNATDLLTLYNDYLDNTADPVKLSDLRDYLNHEKAVMSLSTNNIKIRLGIIKWWDSAYQINNKKREKNVMYRLWNKMDKHPWLTNGFNVWATIWLWIATWWLWTVAWAARSTGIFAGMVWIENAIKKWTHHTKEQKTHEKKLVSEYSKEVDKIRDRENDKNNNWWRTRKNYKARRQLELYNETTQSNIKITDMISQGILDVSSKVWTLNLDDENLLKCNLIEWWARLKYYREVWHNFLASNDKTKTEEDLNKLEKALFVWINKLGSANLSDIESYSATNFLGRAVSFNDIYNAIKEDFKKTDKTFRRRRRHLSEKYWLCTAATSALFSLWWQKVSWTWVFAKNTSTVSWYATSNNISDTFGLWKNELLDVWAQNNIYNWTKSALSWVTDGSTVNISYWAWTDATGFLPGQTPTAAKLSSKISEVKDNIEAMAWLTRADKDIFINEVAWLGWWRGTNWVLQNMRHAEFLEQTARGLSDYRGARELAHPWKTLDLNLVLSHNPKLDVVWTHIKDKWERVVNGIIEISKDSSWQAPKAWKKWFLWAPMFFNTFEDEHD